MASTNRSVLALSLRKSRWELAGAVSFVCIIALTIASTSFFYADDFLYASLFGACRRRVNTDPVASDES